VSGKYPGGFVTAGAPAGYSVYFDGTGDWLTVPNNAALELNGVAFCIEAWVYLTSVSTSQLIIGKRDTSGGTSYAMSYYLQNTAGGVFAFGSYGSGGTNNISITSASGVLKAGAWNHVAVTGDGTNIALYANGVRVSTPTAATLNTSTSLVYLGNFPVDNPLLTGYISNARIVKGSQIYSGTTYNLPTQLLSVSGTSLLTCQSPSIIDNSSNNFTITTVGDAKVSTFTPFAGYTAGASGFRPALGAAAPGVWTLEEATYYQGNRLWPIYDPNFNQTTLMLHGNSPTNLPTWITDASTNNFAITVNGDAKADSQTPFNKTTYPTSGSGYFDGTADQLTLANNAAFDFGSGSFTLECWVYLTATTGSIINYSNGQTSNSNFAWEIYQSSSTGIQLSILSGATAYTASSTAFSLNAWNHVAGVRNGNTLTIYVNGTAGGTTANVTGVIVSSPGGSTVKISGYNNATGMITGYVSNVRIVKGQALATGNFTPPTAPLTTTAVGWTGANAASSITGTISLLTLQNAQPTANSSFIDSSTNNFPITRFGNTTQGTFTPFSQTGWSNFFNGSSNLSAASGPTLSGDFTLEAFVYVTTLNANNMVFGTSSSDNYFGVNTAGLAADFGANAIRWNFTWQTNTWYHIAISRASNTVRAFVNGSQLTLTSGTATDSSTYFSGNILVGRYRFSSALYFTGYISNARVVSGGAIYTGSYTVPTSNLGTTVSAGTVALLTCQSNRFVDNSASPLVVTVANGTPSVQAFSPFPPLTAYTALNVGGSEYSAATGDYLTIPYSTTNFDWFTSGTDYTIEAWIMVTGAGWQSGGQPSTIGNMTPASTTNYWSFGVNSSLQPTFYYFNGSTVTVTFTGVTGTFNQWMHLAMCKTSSGIQLFANGVGGTVTAISGTPQSSTGTTLTIGQNNSVACPGYISGVRIVKGTALYSGSTYTIPTAPPTAVTNTKLLCNFTNAGIIDSTAKNALETLGNAQISTVQSKWGGSSMSFDGTGDYLYYPNNLNAQFGTGDFTIEGWIYINSLAALQVLFEFRATSGATYGQIYITTAGVLRYYLPTDVGTSNTFTTGAWTHFAITRASGTLNMYIGGTRGYTNTYTSAMDASKIQIGADVNGANGLNAYLDDVRITKGVARYTAASFTPPTSQLQSQ
jgi:hypothetical protein